MILRGCGWLVCAAAGCTGQICPPDLGPERFEMAPSGRAAALVHSELFGNIFDWLQGKREDNPSFDCIVERFTEAFENDLDMLVLVLNISRDDFLDRSTRKVISNFTVPQRSFERGIGLEAQTPVLPVGPPRLRSYSFLAVREGLVAGPSLHEIAHGWSAYLHSPEALAQQVQQSPVSHWGFTSVGGVLGGWAPGHVQRFGTFFEASSPSPVEPFSPTGYANNIIPYAPMELYLMGLLPAEEVPDTDVAIDAALVEAPGITPGGFTASSLTTIRMEDIIAAHGARTPGVEGSPKNFEVGLLILAERSLSAGEWEGYERDMDCFAAIGPCFRSVAGVTNGTQHVLFTPLSFNEATGGRAALTFATLKRRGSAPAPTPNVVQTLTSALRAPTQMPAPLDACCALDFSGSAAPPAAGAD